MDKLQHFGSNSLPPPHHLTHQIIKMWHKKCQFGYKPVFNKMVIFIGAIHAVPLHLSKDFCTHNNVFQSVYLNSEKFQAKHHFFFLRFILFIHREIRLSELINLHLIPKRLTILNCNINYSTTLPMHQQPIVMH